TGIADFFARRPDQLEPAALLRTELPGSGELTERMLRAVGSEDGFTTADRPEEALRIVYRRCLAEIVAADLAAERPAEAVSDVSEALADAAAAALEAALAVARTTLADAGGTAARAEVAATRLAIIGMGKAGAHELNYISDVDVIFVGGSADEDAVDEPRAIDIATRLARET